MVEESIILRRANCSDCDAIWRLLHSDGQGWNSQRIEAEIMNIYVLTNGTRLLGLLHKGGGKEQTQKLVVIHPMYPEKPFKEILLRWVDEMMSQSSKKSARPLGALLSGQSFSW